MLLQNKVAMVTGASGGLGLSVAETFAKEGASVALCGRSMERLERTGNIIEKNGLPYSIHYLDVTRKEIISEVVDEILNKYGRIDILVNLAGGSLYTPKEIDKISEDDWDLVIDVNLKGTFLCCQAVIPVMLKQNYGRIVNMSSIGGRTPSLVTGTAYAAAKGGVISFTRRLAKEVGEYGINVNSIASGTVLSGERMIQSWEQLPEIDQGDILRSIPLGRLSTPQEQADGILFLCSRLSDYITGTVLDVNGGRFMI